MMKRERKRLGLSTEKIRYLSLTQLKAANGGIVCTDTCHICDSMDLTGCTTSTTTF